MSAWASWAYGVQLDCEHIPYVQLGHASTMRSCFDQLDKLPTTKQGWTKSQWKCVQCRRKRRVRARIVTLTQWEHGVFRKGHR